MPSVDSLYAWVGTADLHKEVAYLLNVLADSRSMFLATLVAWKERNIDLTKVYTKPNHFWREKSILHKDEYTVTFDGCSLYLYKEVSIQDIIEEIRINGLPEDATEVVNELVNISEGKKKPPVSDAIKAMRKANREIEMERNGGHWTAMNRKYKDKSKYDRKRENKSWKSVEENARRQIVIHSLTENILKNLRRQKFA